VKALGGDVIRDTLATPSDDTIGLYSSDGAAQLGGTVFDPSGASIPNVRVILSLAGGETLETRTDARGNWVFDSIRAGRLRITIDAQGFTRLVREVTMLPGTRTTENATLQLGAVTETVTVAAETVGGLNSTNVTREPRPKKPQVDTSASENVANLQRRVAGVLPIAIDVPHSGASYRFVRPLVIDEETKVTFSYKAR
jgi:hypothetical protein